MTKNEAKRKIERIIKANTTISYGGQFDQERQVDVNTRELTQDLFDFIELYWEK